MKHDQVAHLQQEVNRLQAENQELRRYEKAAEALQTELSELHRRYREEIEQLDGLRYLKPRNTKPSQED